MTNSPCQSARKAASRGSVSNLFELSRIPDVPKGVDCIWAGRAVIEVVATKDGVSSETEKLSSDGEEKSLDYGGYRIHFEKLEPYPKEGITIGEGEYKAWFRLEKL
jgi:hypothetical protein